MSGEQLRRSPLFAELPADALAELVTAGEERHLARGEVLMTEGSPPDAMYLVQDGELAITKRAGDADVLVNVCGPGELLGELGLIHQRPRSATVSARTDATVLRIAAPALEQLLTHPRAARALLVSVTGRLDHQELILRHHERMAALGALTAGLLHEMNNPAAAVQRGVDRLREALAALGEADRELVDWDAAARLALTLDGEQPARRDPIARADVEEALREQLDELGIDRSWELAGALLEAGVDGSVLEQLRADIPRTALAPTLRWLAVRGQITRLLDEVAIGAARVSELVTSVKSYSHETDTPGTDIDVHASLEQALTLLRHRTPEAVNLVRDYDPELPAIQGYPGPLNSVWTNLLDNALDAIGPAGTLTVRTRSEGDTVRVEIVNTGEPPTPEVLARVFDPFFTTKPVGQGTGLGLSTSFSIVTQRHHGELALARSPEGTIATVVLPVSLPAGEGPARGQPPHLAGDGPVQGQAPPPRDAS